MGIVQVDPTRPCDIAYVLGGRSLQHVRAFERRARRSELIHPGGLVIGVVLIGLGAVVGGLTTAGFIVLAMNFRCFGLRRFDRARIHRPMWRAGIEGHMSAANDGAAL
ncbi:MAG: hypothetical protein IPM29_08330 [Planctomycetes bacterium]|nr:hypothetical protein [Planctomycetota bacterium]